MSRYTFPPPSQGWPEPTKRVRNIPMTEQLPGYDALTKAVSGAMLSVCDTTVGEAEQVALTVWNELANEGWEVRKG